MKVSLDALKALREETGASVNDCRLALQSSDGDLAKARDFLRQRGAQIAATRQDRITSQGRVEAYVHHDRRLGALVEVNCETDFVARTPEFVQFCRDVAIHVAAMNPRYLRKEEIPTQDNADDRRPQAVCLLEQPFVKDQSLTVGELLQSLIAKTGEKVVIQRFTRFLLGDATGSRS